MSKRQLIDKCLSVMEENKILKEFANLMQTVREDTISMHHEFKLQTAQLQRETDDRVKKQMAEIEEERRTLQQTTTRIHEEQALIERSEAGLRTAVIQQTREIVSLRTELDALKSELLLKERHSELAPAQYLLSTRLVKNIRSMVIEMGDHLTDPVSFDLLLDPITLYTGHTLNRDIINRLRSDTTRGVFKCPFTRQNISVVTAHPKSITIANLSALYMRMNSWLDAAALELSQH